MAKPETLAPLFMDAQLRKDIWTIWNILLHCNENLSISKYLYNPETEDEKDYVNVSREIKYIRFSLWKIGIIEINKILSHAKNDEYSLWNLMTKLKTGKYSDHKISNELITSWEIGLKSAKNTLKKISTLRNKSYAHTDSDINSKEATITFEEVEIVLKIIEKVVKDVYEHAFGSTIIHKTLIFKKERFNMIKILANERKERLQYIIDLGKSYGIG